MSAWVLSILIFGTMSAKSCEPESSVGLSTAQGCTRSKMRSVPLRVAFLDKQYVTQNQAAINKIASLNMQYSFGKSCDSALTAVPEWCVDALVYAGRTNARLRNFDFACYYSSFVAENWQYGWLGQFMFQIFSSNLQLKNIVAMTSLNFTGATDPKNKTSVYKGASLFTRSRTRFLEFPLVCMIATSQYRRSIKND